MTAFIIFRFALHSSTGLRPMHFCFIGIGALGASTCGRAFLFTRLAHLAVISHRGRRAAQCSMSASRDKRRVGVVLTRLWLFYRLCHQFHAAAFTGFRDAHYRAFHAVGLCFAAISSSQTDGLPDDRSRCRGQLASPVPCGDKSITHTVAVTDFKRPTRSLGRPHGSLMPAFSTLNIAAHGAIRWRRI